MAASVPNENADDSRNTLELLPGSSTDALMALLTGEAYRVSSTQSIECLKAAVDTWRAKEGKLDSADCIRIAQAHKSGHPHSVILLFEQLHKIRQQSRYIILTSGHIPVLEPSGHKEKVKGLGMDLDLHKDAKMPAFTEHQWANPYWWVFHPSEDELGLYSKCKNVQKLHEQLDAMFHTSNAESVSVIRLNLGELKKALKWTEDKERRGRLPEIILLYILSFLIKSSQNSRERRIRWVSADPLCAPISWVVPKPITSFMLKNPSGPSGPSNPSSSSSSATTAEHKV